MYTNTIEYTWLICKFDTGNPYVVRIWQKQKKKKREQAQIVINLVH